MHALGQVDRLEIGGEGAHQASARSSGRLASDAPRRSTVPRLLAAADRGAADPFDVGEKVGTFLLGQDFADQGAQPLDVLAQQAVAGAESRWRRGSSARSGGRLMPQA